MMSERIKAALARSKKELGFRNPSKLLTGVQF
jgi:hypothetical protein